MTEFLFLGELSFFNDLLWLLIHFLLNAGFPVAKLVANVACNARSLYGNKNKFSIYFWIKVSAKLYQL